MWQPLLDVDGTTLATVAVNNDGAGVPLRRSIRLDFAAVSVILAVTATLTTVAALDMER